MQKYKKLIPVAALILLALGVNLERFGIDLQALTGQGNGAQTQNEPSSSQPDRGRGESSSTPGTAQPADPSARGKLPHWSDTSPEINLWHVFEGEINSRGKPTGFHARPGGRDPAAARVVSIEDRPNRLGVYTANVEVRDGTQWKRKFSSFFPDELSQREVVDVILHAYSNSRNPNKQPWSGPSGRGFQVQGYTSSRGGINTAFPIYSRNQ